MIVTPHDNVDLAGMSDDGDEEVFVFPATAAQRRFWLLDQLVSGGNPALNMPLAVRLTGRLDIKALERSGNEIVRRHEILRTTFHPKQGQLQQIIAPGSHLPLMFVDLGDLPAAERVGTLESLMAEEARRTFDLAHGPLIRMRLTRVGDTEHLLLITLHHIVTDGWSNGVLLRELGELYTAFTKGQPSPLPELTIQFADFVQWQQEQANGPDDPLAYWRSSLTGELPVIDLPTDRPRRPRRGQPPAGGVRQVALPLGLVQSLKALAAMEGVSAYMLYLAAFTVLLSRYSGGQEDVLVITPSANRDQREVEGLIGPFVNPLLLRIDLSGDPTFRELLRRVRRTALGAFEHAVTAFETIIEEFQPRLLQADFLYQNDFLRPASLPELEMTPLTTTNGAGLTEWSAAVTESGTETRFFLSYNAELFGEATMDRALRSYRQILASIAAPGGLETIVAHLPVEVSPGGSRPSIMVVDHRRLPVGSARWMDGCHAADGRALPGTEIMVLDRHMQPAPMGVAGEIYVHGMPEAVGHALVAPQWMEHPQKGRLLKTGDLARRQPGDRIEWLGPLDEQRTVQGLRVQVSMIERALTAHPHVTDAVVLWRGRRDSQERRLVAFLQTDGGAHVPVTHGQWREFLRETLPDEWMPVTFVPMEGFPLTDDGRLDVARFPDPETGLVSGPEEKYAAPYLTIHHQIIEIWSSLLHARPIGVNDDFFALGGNSLLAMQMLNRIERLCGKALLPATLFRKATVEGLAEEILRREEGATHPDLITICETGAKTPIFYLHGDLTGGGYYCMKLSRRLGPDQPFYALPPYNKPVDLLDLPSIEVMAAAHLEALRRVRPHGPYVIGGFCIGGLVALELARQLEAAGERVERLLIIDAEAENRRFKTLRRMAARLGRLRGWTLDRQLHHFCRWHFVGARLSRVMDLDFGEQRAIFSRRLADKWRHLRQRIKADAPGEAEAPEAEGAWFDPRWDVPLIFLWAMGGYEVKSHGGPTTLLLSHDLLGGTGTGPVQTWKKYCSRLEWHELAGSHLACITEHVDALADMVRSCLEAEVK